MKKHIFGFAVFSFIVAVTVIISSFLIFKTPAVQVNQPSVPHYSGKTYCWKYKQQRESEPVAARKETARVKIEQSVLDLKTKQLKTFLSVRPQRGSEAGENYTVALHFFVKDGKSSRYVSTETVWVNSLFDSEKESLLTSLKWFENLDAQDNLYIVPEIADGWKDYKQAQPIFDNSSAASVLIKR
jgi:phage-related protein